MTRTLRLTAMLVLLIAGCSKGAGRMPGRQARVVRGDFRLTVQATGNVQPLNKVQILPPVGGRIDKILALEGRFVKKGDTLAWMSSSDRAVLLDNARAKGPEEVKYWEEAYKPTPIIAPADGLIISRNVVEGQTVSAQTDLYDLSDRLIVQADVDETDLGKITMEQKALVTVDAYPDKPFRADVSLISHQSVKVNNVVTYEVQLDPQRTPGILRAGMTANVDFILDERPNVLLLPAWAVRGAEQTTVTLSVLPGGGRPGGLAGGGGTGARHGGGSDAGGWSGRQHRDGGAADAADQAGAGHHRPGSATAFADGGEAAKGGSAKSKPAETRSVQLGPSDGNGVIVLSGLAEGDAVLVDSLKLPDAPSSGLFAGPGRPGTQSSNRGGGGRGGGGR